MFKKTEISKTIGLTLNTGSDDIFDIAANPSRSIEFRQWIQNNKEEAVHILGKNKEKLIHWAALLDLGIFIDLVQMGCDINSKDELGRTPLDWIASRLFFVCLSKKHQHSYEVKNNIISITKKIVPYIISVGGTGSQDVRENLEVWARTGIWEAIFVEFEKNKGELFIGQEKNSILHYFPVAYFADDKEVINYLNAAIKYGCDINYQNAKGFTSLMVAAENWIAGYVRDERIIFMIQMGADPEISNDFDENSFEIINRIRKDKLADFEKIYKRAMINQEMVN